MPEGKVIKSTTTFEVTLNETEREHLSDLKNSAISACEACHLPDAERDKLKDFLPKFLVIFT